MKCAEVEKHLSIYMDGELPQDLGVQVESHLSECRSCRKKLEALKSMTEQLGQVPKAVAPPDFIHRLHDRIETETWTQKIRRALFIPSGIKIPLELAAAISVGILIFFIAQPIQQHLLPQKQEDQKFAVAEKGKSKPDISLSIETELTPLTPLPAAPSPIGLGRSRKITEPPAMNLERMKEVRENKHQGDLPRGQVIAKAPVTEPESMRIKDESASAPIVISLMVPAQKEFSAESPNAVGESAEATLETPNELAKRKSTVLSGAASPLPQTAEQDAELPSAVSPPATAKTVDQKIIDLVDHIQGKLISMERKDDGMPISMNIEIPASKYHQFIDQILQFGEIESRPHGISSSGEELIPITIHLIIHP